MTIEKVKSLIKKLHSLSERGLQAEADVAQGKINELLDKYNLKLTEVISDARKDFAFSFKSKFERKLFWCIYFHTLEDWNRRIYTMGRKEYVSLTNAEYIEIDLLFNYYRKAWGKDIAFVFKAFIFKHKLFPKDRSVNKDKERTMSIEDLLKLKNLMDGLKEPSLQRHKRIEHSKKD